MYHENINIHGQNDNSNDNLREAQAINKDNRGIACDNGDEDFAQLDVFSDFISQVCNVLCEYIYLRVYLLMSISINVYRYIVYIFISIHLDRCLLILIMWE
jgi:hypothetical protein